MIRFSGLSSSNLAELEPLWHQELVEQAPELIEVAPPIESSRSWAIRSEQLRQAWMQGAVGVLAHDEGKLVGAAFAARRPMQWEATFAIPPFLWEIIVLHVVPHYRRQKLGSALLNGVAQAARAADPAAATLLAGTLQLPATAGFLTRHGFRRAWVTLTRIGQLDALHSPRDGEPSLSLASREQSRDLGPLWLRLHHHHQSVAPELGPFVPDGPSWEVICPLFSKSAEEQLLVLAHESSGLKGLACAAVYPAAEAPFLAERFSLAPLIGETKFLIVDADVRGHGVGGKLLDDIDRRLANRGATDQLIGAIASNARAIQFYRRRGFRDTWFEWLTPLS